MVLKATVKHGGGRLTIWVCVAAASLIQQYPLFFNPEVFWCSEGNNTNLERHNSVFFLNLPIVLLC